MMVKRSARFSVTTLRSSTPLPIPPLSWPTVPSLAPRIGTSWPTPAASGSPAFQRPCTKPRPSWPRPIPRPWRRSRRAIARTPCHRARGASRNAGSSSIPSRASRRPSAPSTSRGTSRVPTKSKLSRRCAARTLPVKRMPTRPWRLLPTPCRPRFSLTVPSAPTPPYGKRGRPGSGAQPDQIVYPIAGARASRLTDRQARVDQQRCFLLATNELDEGQVSAQAVRDGYQGQAQAERGVRFLKAPQFLASSLYLKKPERLMALLRVMTVCLLGYAALAYRMRTALKEHAATFPDQKGKRSQNPTARWVFHYFVGIHVPYSPEQGLLLLNV